MEQPKRRLPALYSSPLQLSTRRGDAIANFMEEGCGVPLNLVSESISHPHFTLSGPRQQVAFQGEDVVAGLITCGGLCPGLNDVIRGVVHSLWHRYHVRQILGFRYGYYGLSSLGMSEHPPLTLTPESVRSIHRLGGSHLGSSRGAPDFDEIVDTLERLGVNQLYCIGGDGTMRGATALAEALEVRGVSLSVIGIPKTIDNDLPFVERTFGFDTAISMAVDAVRAARAEASSGLRGVGLVKLMGRHAGFIAASAAIASREADLVLVPELPFALGELGADSNRGVMPYLERVIAERGEAVVIIAEGVGQGQGSQPKLSAQRGFDASGNSKLGDVGIAFKRLLSDTFHAYGEPVNIKYIDPSYMIRATPVSTSDAMYCAQLAEDAVHAGMAGFSEVLVGRWGGVGTLVPFTLLVNQTKRLDLDGVRWRNALEATGQPSVLT